MTTPTEADIQASQYAAEQAIEHGFRPGGMWQRMSYDRIRRIIEAAFRAARAAERADVLFNEVAAKLREQKRLIPPTPEEAQAAYDAAVPVPVSKERIQEIVDFAVGRTSGCPRCGRPTMCDACNRGECAAPVPLIVQARGVELEPLARERLGLPAPENWTPEHTIILDLLGTDRDDTRQPGSGLHDAWRGMLIAAREELKRRGRELDRLRFAVQPLTDWAERIDAEGTANGFRLGDTCGITLCLDRLDMRPNLGDLRWLAKVFMAAESAVPASPAPPPR